jgi:IMP dehydrogenase
MELKTATPRLEAGASTTALTFDDVLLVPTHSDGAAGPGGRLDAPHAQHRPERAAAQRRDGHGHRVGDGHRHGAAGRLGVIHKNLPIEEQASEVDRVKRSESGMIVNPITLSPHRTASRGARADARYRISGVPITEDGSKEGRLVGILTNRDLRFETNVDRPVSEVMTKENSSPCRSARRSTRRARSCTSTRSRSSWSSIRTSG